MKNSAFKTLILGLMAAALLVTACTKREDARRDAMKRGDNVTVNINDNRTGAASSNAMPAGR